MSTRVEAPPRPRPATSRTRPSPFLLGAGIAVAVAAAIPALYLVVRAWTGGWTAIASTLWSPALGALLLRTTLLCAAVTATACTIAVPLAWFTVRSDLPLRSFWTVATTLPLVVPSFVGGYTFVAALGPRGLVQGWLEPLGVDRLPSIYGFGGAWLVLTLFTYPLVLLTTRAALRGLDPAYEEAARSLGRSPRQAFLRITLPQLRPAIGSGAMLVALYVLSDFGAVSLLRFDSFTRSIYVAYQSSFDRTRAATLSAVLVAMMGVLLWIEGRSRSHAPVHRTRTPRPPAPTHLGRWRWPVFGFCLLLVGVALALPLSVIGLWLYRGVLAGEPLRLTLGAAANSLHVSALAGVVAVVCAWPVAVLSSRHRSGGVTAIERVSHAGYALPGIVVALALVFFGARYATPLYQTRTMLVFAYLVLFLPQAIGALRASLANVPPALEEAARSLGARPFDVLRRVTVPLVRPGIASGAALVFLTAMKELPATLLLAPTGFRTLATGVWNATSEAFFARAAAPALALVVLSSAPLAVLMVRERYR